MPWGLWRVDGWGYDAGRDHGRGGETLRQPRSEQVDVGDDGVVQFNNRCGALSRRPAHNPPIYAGTAPDLTSVCRRAARSGRWIPAGLPWLACVAGKVYFEVTVVEAVGVVVVGWAGTSFSDIAVGADKEAASWGIFKDGRSYHRRVLLR